MNPEAWRTPARLAAAALSGALLFLTFPPAELWWLVFVALVPLLLALRGARGRAGFVLGLVAGAAFLGPLIWWIASFGYLAWGALLLAQALFIAVFGWFGAWTSRSVAGRLFALPVLFAGLEVVRTVWPLGGFAWGDLGYTQYDAGPMLALARVGGVHLITLGIVVVNVLVASAIASGRVWARAVAVVVAGGIVVAPAGMPLGLAGPTGERLDVALVQGNVAEGTFTGFGDRLGRRGPEDLRIIENHIEATDALRADPPDLVVWPENAVDRDPFGDPSIGMRIEETVRGIGAPFIVGAILDEPGGGFRNTNLFYDRDGRPTRRYEKVHLVPFGEYVPWPKLRDWISALEQIPEDGVPGTHPVVFDVGGAKVGTVICFESTYPSYVRSVVRDGAEVVVVSTNNASFRRSPLARQHVQMSVLRAVEEGRTVLHAAISGITAVIDARGTILQRTPLFEQAVVRRSVPLASGETPYVRFGEAIESLLIGLACAAVVAGTLGMIAGRRARRLAQAETELWGERDLAT